VVIASPDIIGNAEFDFVSLFTEESSVNFACLRHVIVIDSTIQPPTCVMQILCSQPTLYGTAVSTGAVAGHGAPSDLSDDREADREPVT